MSLTITATRSVCSLVLENVLQQRGLAAALEAVTAMRVLSDFLVSAT
ncbi:hypothetical protein PF005_g16009 [Phytophthora fragariae]|uniref:Uncharacterized protein n=2 Tax=Phytophthora TaxID=4783 RepID=A0A6A3YBW7_9STRA|nr:hypothetical protein PF003_g24611 [Phytophthora fragariae]KAE9009056.1 hypothetical protein PR002_g15717 [Phytophthora rubi]KAE8923871.1 hypothetical protein PF009_g25885 [Phytophthora fragariae]KAE8978156.1 hypothetical protein PF011_g23359 [Phytophthora fragariae]KAE9097378.1 hypothetical protein PF010_g15985 [Phytophthora fragariae]